MVFFEVRVRVRAKAIARAELLFSGSQNAQLEPQKYSPTGTELRQKFNSKPNSSKTQSVQLELRQKVHLDQDAIRQKFHLDQDATNSNSDPSSTTTKKIKIKVQLGPKL
jgi:hypothetical protein